MAVRWPLLGIGLLLLGVVAVLAAQLLWRSRSEAGVRLGDL